ncbi:MAG TPA: hypothetical protein DEQ47_13090 [Solibacterales bacterium]|nr:hypothetical protein [Bryobacterales bacterium]
MDCPRFKRRYCVRVLDAESTAVVWETGYTVLHGRLTALLAPHLQGEYTLAEIQARLNGTLNVLDIGYGLAQLSRLGYLEEQPEAVRMRVIAMGVDTAWFESLLRAEGVNVAPDGDIWVAVVDHYLHPDLEALNRAALERRVPWLMVKPAGALPSFGPVFRPFETACWECLAARRREMPAYRLLDGPPVFATTHPGAAAAVTAMAAASVLNLSRACELVTFDPVACTLEKHAVVRRQYCSACGEPAPAQARPVILESAAPATASHEHHISPVTGIVASLQRTGDNVFTAVHNFALTSGRSPLSRGATSAGKGLTEDQARTSALCEALERYSGCFRGTEPLVTSSFDALRGAIHPNACMLFSAAQYREREAWNRREGEYNWVPQAFDPSRAIEWAPMWSLTHQEFRYLPAAYCYYNYPLPEDHDFCRADSNGNAAGNSLEEAILHGFYEVVERDAAALWWYTRVPRPAVELEVEAINPLRERMARSGWNVWAIDLTTDFDIPVFAAMAQRARSSDPPAPLGFGAHLDPRVALGRAFAEASQGISLMTDDRPPRVSIGADPDGAYLWPAGNPVRYKPRSGGDLKTCIARAARLGLETLVLDQTRADVGLRVVKVIVPGMRHFWARFAEGRLYCTATPEAGMNPAHLVI